MLDKWERAPVYYKRLDVSGLLQQASIEDVEMEDYEEPAVGEGKDAEGEGAAEKEEEEDEELPDVRSFSCHLFCIQQLTINNVYKY